MFCCDEETIKNKECCSDIFNKWDIVFHKRYSYEKGILDYLFDLITVIIKIIEIKMSGGLNPNLINNNPIYEINEMDKLVDLQKKIGVLKGKPSDLFIDISLNIDWIDFIKQFIYLYNFAILKNDEYKKIVVTFPGTSSYLQILEEIVYQEMKDISLKEEKK